MGVFVTKFCSNQPSHKNVQKESPNSNENINRYSVTTLSRLVLFMPKGPNYVFTSLRDKSQSLFSFGRCLNGT